MPSTLFNFIAVRANKTCEVSFEMSKQGLRTYLLAYGAFYHSLSQEQLCEMFDMSDKEVWLLNPMFSP